MGIGSLEIDMEHCPDIARPAAAVVPAMRSLSAVELFKLRLLWG